MKPKEFFHQDPIISWDKVYCPLCKEPTGSKSKCYELSPDKQEQRLITKGYGVLPTYSKNCIYRQDNIWIGNINYPFSNPLMNRLSPTQGVEKILAIKPHAFQVSIGKAFDEKIVLDILTREFRAFIKEMHVLEINVLQKQYDLDPFYSGIQFPNGQKFLSENLSKDELLKQSIILENVIENLSETKGIINKEPETK